MAWVSPTGHNDPDSFWSDEVNVYDENTGTYAESDWISHEDWSSFLELSINEIRCSKVRFLADVYSAMVNQIDLDVYYNGAWHNVYQGSYSDMAWVEKSLGGSYHVTQARVRFYNSHGFNSDKAEFYEFDFWEIETPTVTTQAVTNINDNTATGNGNITATGGENATKRGVCWNKTGNPTVADSKSEETGSFGTGAFTRPITGLDPNVQYFVKAYAYNEAGYAYGGQVDFTTNKTTPTVTTQDATEINQNQVKGNGNITASGGENATERGFEYGLTETATWTEKETGSYEVGAFDLVIDELEGNTEYWYRAYAKNSIGTGYGGWVQFQTLAPGTIPTGAVLDICSDYSGYTYQLHGAETDDGATYTGYFVLSTDLADKQGLPVKKRLLDLNLYFKKESSGSVNIYIKEDNEANWQDAGSVDLTGSEDIVVKHLPVDYLAKHYLIKISGANAFRFIGATLEHIPVGLR